MKKERSRKFYFWLIIIFLAVVIVSSFYVFTKFEPRILTGKAISSSTAAVNFKVMTWNLHGEALADNAQSDNDWKNIPRSVSEIINLISSENPDLVVFDAVHINFENQLKQAMIQRGYIYSYIDMYLPTTYPQYKKAIFSKSAFSETNKYLASGFNNGGTGENYASKNQILEVKMVLAGKTYSFFAGHIAAGKRQIKLNNDYFQLNVYQPLINADKPHFILGDFNMFLDAPDMNWYNTVYTSADNFPNAKFYNQYYNDVCQLYMDSSCDDSAPPVDGSGRIDQIIFRDFSGSKSIYLKKAHIRRDANNNWAISDHYPVFAEFLITPTQITSGDYNKDGKTDVAIVSNTGFKWEIYNPSKALIHSSSWGYTGAFVVPGDYNGGGKADIAVWNAIDGKWYIRNIDGNAIVNGLAWGSKGMTPVSGDYDGDGKDDLALWNPTDGKWYILKKDGNTIANGLAWGSNGMIPVSGDYDGDGKSDLAVWNRADGKWYIQTVSGTNLAWARQFGSNGVIPLSGDFNGDGKSDLAYYNLANKNFYFDSIIATIPLCTENNWISSLSPSTCPSTEQQTKTWIKVKECSGGITHPSSEIISCTYIPTAIPCTSFAYSEWSECSDFGKQTRIVTGSSPSGCTGGSPVLIQDCNYIPLCTENNWISDDSVCSSSNTLIRDWTKIGNCDGGIQRTISEIVACDYAAITCKIFVYSDWSECLSSSIRTRSIISSYPDNCADGNPITSETCEYTSSFVDGGSGGGSGGGGSGGGWDEAENNSLLDYLEKAENIYSKNQTPFSQKTNISGNESEESAQQQKGLIKTILVKIVCRISHLFNEESYWACMEKYL